MSEDGYFKQGAWVEIPKPISDLNKLVGKLAIRTQSAHCNKNGHNGGYWCTSFTTDPVLIRSVTQDHVIVQWTRYSGSMFEGDDCILNHDYIDGNWVEFIEPPGGFQHGRNHTLETINKILDEQPINPLYDLMCERNPNPDTWAKDDYDALEALFDPCSPFEGDMDFVAPCGETVIVAKCYNCPRVIFHGQRECALTCGRATSCRIAGIIDYSNHECDICFHSPQSYQDVIDRQHEIIGEQEALEERYKTEICSRICLNTSCERKPMEIGECIIASLKNGQFKLE